MKDQQHTRRHLKAAGAEAAIPAEADSGDADTQTDSAAAGGQGEGPDDRRDRGADEETEKEDLPQFLAHPSRADIWLFVAFFAVAIYGLALIPLRAFLLSHPLAYTLLVGGYTSAVVSGATASVGRATWWVLLACSVFGAVKFMPLYWALGRRWGMEFIDMSVRYTPRIKRLVARALSGSRTAATGWTCALVPLGFAPGPVPNNIVNALLGLLRLPLWAMLAVNVVSVLVVNGAMMWLGWTFGDQVLEVIDVVNRYLLWITLALLAVVVWRARRQSRAAKAARR